MIVCCLLPAVCPARTVATQSSLTEILSLLWPGLYAHTVGTHLIMSWLWRHGESGERARGDEAMQIKGRLHIQPGLTIPQQNYLKMFISISGHRQPIHHLEAIASEPADLKKLREDAKLPPLRQYLLFGNWANYEVSGQAWVDSRLLSQEVYSDGPPSGHCPLTFSPLAPYDRVSEIDCGALSQFNRVSEIKYGALSQFNRGRGVQVVGWVCYLVKQLFVPWGAKVEGQISWENLPAKLEVTPDMAAAMSMGSFFGKVRIKDNQVTEIPGRLIFDEPGAVIYQPPLG